MDCKEIESEGMDKRFFLTAELLSSHKGHCPIESASQSVS
jgi:hypothetical protein